MTRYLGIDIGKTKIAFSLVTKKGNIEKYFELPADTREGGKHLFSQVVANVRQILEEEKRIACIGIGTTGMVDPRAGLIVGSGSLPNYRDIPARSILEEVSGLPVVVENDIHAATAGEYIFGAGKGKSSIAYLGVGTGVGVGFVIKGEIHYGAHRLAGQIAHIPLFGNMRTINDLASGKGLARRASAIYGKDISAQYVLDNQSQFREIIEEMIEALAAVVAWIQQTIDPEMIVMGGGVMINHPELVDKIKHRSDIMLEKYSMMLYDGVPLVLSTLRQYAGVLGAAALCMMRPGG